MGAWFFALRISATTINTEDRIVKKTLSSLIVVILLSLALAVPSFAERGQVRGENGQGSVNQVQIQNPPPFQP